MSTLIKSLMGLVTPEMIAKTSEILGEKGANVETAVKSTFSTILGGILQKGGSSELLGLFKDASSNNILSNISNIFDDSSNDSIKKVGGGFITSLFGDKTDDAVSMVSSHSGISKESSWKLFSMISPIVAGFFGNHLQISKIGINELINTISNEKSSFTNIIPPSFSQVLGVKETAQKVSYFASGVKEEIVKEVEEVGAFGFGWLKWLLPLVALLGGFFYFFNKEKITSEVVALDLPAKGEAIKNTLIGEAKEVKAAVVKNIDKAVAGSETLLTNAAQQVDTSIGKVRELIDYKLPNGSILKGYQSGIEERMINFLESEDYLIMDEDELKQTWFDFDNIHFEFGSSTELTKESAGQIENIAAILKHFKGAVIKLGAYTDKKGDENVNLKTSNDRAITVRNLLIKAGVAESQIDDAEGYGSKFATIDADASDSERAKDRRVAIRFESINR